MLPCAALLAGPPPADDELLVAADLDLPPRRSIACRAGTVESVRLDTIALEALLVGDGEQRRAVVVGRRHPPRRRRLDELLEQRAAGRSHGSGQRSWPSSHSMSKRASGDGDLGGDSRRTSAGDDEVHAVLEESRSTGRPASSTATTSPSSTASHPMAAAEAGQLGEADGGVEAVRRSRASSRRRRTGRADAHAVPLDLVHPLGVRAGGASPAVAFIGRRSVGGGRGGARHGRRLGKCAHGRHLLPLAGTGALITGGGSGIGLGAARHLLRDGATVTLFGRDQGRLDAGAASLADVAPEGRRGPDRVAATRATRPTSSGPSRRPPPGRVCTGRCCRPAPARWARSSPRRSRSGSG